MVVTVAPELSPVTVLRQIVGCCGAGAPKAPLCKGSWHGEAVTEGLCGEMLRICILLGEKGLLYYIINILTNTKGISVAFIILNFIGIPFHIGL